MKYTELYDEYVSLTREVATHKRSLGSLKRGYISHKTISRRSYAYLQRRENGILVSEYIRKYDLPNIKAELNERTRLLKRTKEISNSLEKIETAVKTLDAGLHRKIVTFRRCAAMDLLSLEKRRKSSDFSHAMTALEGIPVSIDTEVSLYLWEKGNKSFYDCFMSTLRAYNLAED